MIAALSLSAWRTRGRRQVWAVLAALAVGIHVLAMAAHQPPADLTRLDPGPAAEFALLDPHALCLTSGEAPTAPDGSGAPLHPHAPPCTICQSLHAAVPPPQAPLIVAFPWAVAQAIAPPAGTAPPPRLVLTDLNPRGPPLLG
jgi:hypothetical protein